MKIYQVGGCVRDELLGLPGADRDWVVVGATAEEMERLGYKPVGRDFPVFLHPETREEYALARTERKVSRGYKGFTVYAAPEVTLEEDLARRDLTINAIARDGEGRLVDPFGGERDLKAGILRHVGPAFVEDPVRVLRVARFAARFGFAVAPETLALMREIVAGGEADALVAERVWQEFARGLMEPLPGRMFAVLALCGALAKLAPELGLRFEADEPADEGTRVAMNALAWCAAAGHALAVRFGALARSARDAGEPGLRALCARLKAPAECRDVALLCLRELDRMRRAGQLTPQEKLALLEACDAFRRPERFSDLLRAAEAETRGERRAVELPYAPRTVLEAALERARSVNAGAIAASSARGEIAPRLRRARIAAIAAGERR
ncbi:MAG: multifunctional CCA tRNA nucleotidyl transferase/2'3'-cyclic phosphodiesterase/2'nucleotidase/phosphatase [Betaproteobacteria bacterium RIFCSPLOWO2_12_FULL_65_14]|nr:MAG: multifunctional CCA tRNA nucleotidyl transferase/2'3'-cyclic phosphodiesterase/2'nucleotidase/phosphatase [Betaproteobacteria bacterium RIFCSPLOWO2_12_FULL_65_14]